ncbi:MAG: hypothetical protein ABSD64_07610 [Terriglobales bacterium]|jgi:hypothetical protein
MAIKSKADTSADFLASVETKVTEQLKAQRVAYLLGAGSSFLGGSGYPLTGSLWGLIRGGIADQPTRAEIQAKLDSGASGVEQALDLLDRGLAQELPHRHAVTQAIADHFMTIRPSIEHHKQFLQRLVPRSDRATKIFSLNYDPLIERAADVGCVRLTDGFLGNEQSFFDSAVFQERIGQIRGTYKGRQFDETVRPIKLFKLHGSLGWYECPILGVRRCPSTAPLPPDTKRLMIPPQYRKATDTMMPPYAALWSAFRGALSQDAYPVNRLVCIGYGFLDEHVNAVVENGLGRADFTLLILTKALSDAAWTRWSRHTNVIVVTEARCSLKGTVGPGHGDLWSFERLCREV